MFDVVIAIFVFAGSLIITRLMIAYARNRKLLDVPNERSSHAIPTPRGGGLALVVVFLLGMVVLYYRNDISLAECLALTGGGMLVAIVGFWDDHCKVSANIRIVVHAIAAVWVVYWLGGLPSFAIGFTAQVVAINLFWIVALTWFLNAYNFMDGIDGIAGSEVVFISAVASMMCYWSGAQGLAMVGVLLAAGSMGFLFWNLPPAKIFMGDVGSGFLGLVLGAMAILTVRNGIMNMWVWTILFGVFMVDATITIFRRIINGACWHRAHCSHAYQHASRLFGKHGKVTGAVTALNVLWLLPWAACAWRWSNWGAFFAVIAYLPLIWLALRLGAGLDKNPQPLLQK